MASFYDITPPTLRGRVITSNTLITDDVKSQSLGTSISSLTINVDLTDAGPSNQTQVARGKTIIIEPLEKKTTRTIMLKMHYYAAVARDTVSNQWGLADEKTFVIRKFSSTSNIAAGAFPGGQYEGIYSFLNDSNTGVDEHRFDIYNDSNDTLVAGIGSVTIDCNIPIRIKSISDFFG